MKLLDLVQRWDDVQILIENGRIYVHTEADAAWYREQGFYVKHLPFTTTLCSWLVTLTGDKDVRD